MTALQARKALAEQGIIGHDSEIDVIDTPYLSETPEGLRDALSHRMYENVLFADICKEGECIAFKRSMILNCSC